MFVVQAHPHPGAAAGGPHGDLLGARRCVDVGDRGVDEGVEELAGRRAVVDHDGRLHPDVGPRERLGRVDADILTSDGGFDLAGDGFAPHDHERLVAARVDGEKRRGDRGGGLLRGVLGHRDGDLHHAHDHEADSREDGHRPAPDGESGGHCSTTPPALGWKVSGPSRMPSAVSFSANLGRMPVGLRTPR